VGGIVAGRRQTVNQALQIPLKLQFGEWRGRIDVKSGERGEPMEELERVYEAALGAMRRGEPTAVATVIETYGSTPRQVGAKMLITADGQTVGTVGGGQIEAQVIQDARAAIAEGRSRQSHYRSPDPQQGPTDRCADDMQVFIEVLLPRATLLIIGAGHIGQAVARMGAFLGYRIVVLDERAEMVTVERFPQADVLLSGPIDEQLSNCPLTEQTYAVLVTPHHSRDEVALAALAEHRLPYVGLLGSRRRTQATFERAQTIAVPADFLAQVHAPIGFDIGGETPREIAVSILAEIVAVQHGKRGQT
jgi:xanthine dehydrogenase accessory factor